MSSFRNNLYLIALLQPLILITSCGQESELSNKNTPRYTVMEGSSCFNQRDISEYTVLDRGNLIVYGRPRSRSYHIQISPPTSSIRGSDSIGFKSLSGRICGFAGDKLIIPNSIFQESYSIITVKQLNETAHNNLLVRFGKAEPIEQVEPEKDASPEIQRELSEDENQEKEVNNE